MLHPGYCPIVIPHLLVRFRSRADRCACPEPKADQDTALSRRIDELIRNLGARQVAERERAAKGLVDIGALALVPLRRRRVRSARARRGRVAVVLDEDEPSQPFLRSVHSPPGVAAEPPQDPVLRTLDGVLDRG